MSTIISEYVLRTWAGLTFQILCIDSMVANFTYQNGHFNHESTRSSSTETDITA